MTPQARRDARNLIKRVEEILWKEWNPIGWELPRDEYDSYAPEVARMVLNGASANEIATHLDGLAFGHIGMSERADIRQRGVAAARSLIALTEPQ